MFFFNCSATSGISTLSLRCALPISALQRRPEAPTDAVTEKPLHLVRETLHRGPDLPTQHQRPGLAALQRRPGAPTDAVAETPLHLGLVTLQRRPGLAKQQRRPGLAAPQRRPGAPTDAVAETPLQPGPVTLQRRDRKSTRPNSSHVKPTCMPTSA